MAEQQNFRSAFSGFNREDVVRYLEYLNSKHASEISQLNSEIEYLRTQTGAAPADTAELENPLLEQQAAQIEELSARFSKKDEAIAQLTEEADALKAEIAVLKETVSQKDGEITVLKAEIEQLRQSKPSALRMEEELEIYRRAERVERRAKERADLVYHRVNGTLADATCKVEDAASIIGEMSEKVLSQLNELQAAVTGSKAALKDAADTMYALRPEPED
jgi:chromosome segregation ATPase